MRRSLRGSAPQALVFADQLTYSMCNFVCTIVAARSLSVDEFGKYVLIFTALILIVGLQRAAFLEPLMVVVGNSSAQYKLIVRAARLVGLFGLSIAVLSIFVVLVSSHSAMSFLFLLAIGPFIQDGTRYILYVTRGPSQMLASDLVSCVAQLTLLILLSLTGNVSYEAYILAWCLGAFVGPMCFGRLVFRSVWNPDNEDDRSQYRSMHFPFGFDYLLGVISLQGTLLAASAAVGVQAAAALRGADALLGPFRIALQALPPVLLRRWSSNNSQKSSFRPVMLGSFMIVVIVAPLALLIRWIPGELGEMVLGASWTVAKPIVPLVLISLAPITLSYLSSIAIKAAGRGAVLVRCRLITLPITLSCGVGGALLAGAIGAAAGALLGSCIAAIVFFVAHVRIDRNAQ